MIKISNGAEAREWREKLGLTREQVAAAAACGISASDVEIMEAWSQVSWTHSEAWTSAITAALTAEYQRQAREALAETGRAGLPWAKRFRPDLHSAWCNAVGAVGVEDAWAAILAALREAAGEPVQPAPALVEPVAPEGVTNVRWLGHCLTYSYAGTSISHYPHESDDVTEWAIARSRYEQAKAKDAARKLAAVDEAQRAVEAASKAMDDAQAAYQEATKSHARAYSAHARAYSALGGNQVSRKGVQRPRKGVQRPPQRQAGGRAVSDKCQMCDGFGDAPGAGLLPESDCPECNGTGRDCGYRPNPRLCEICGCAAMALGSEPRCAEHDNERSE